MGFPSMGCSAVFSQEFTSHLIKHWTYSSKLALVHTTHSLRKKPDKVLTAGTLVEQQVFLLTVKSLKRLKIASALVCYYESVSIPLNLTNMKWRVLKSFDTQMKAMKDRKKDGASDFPSFQRIPLYRVGIVLSRSTWTMNLGPGVQLYAI